MHESRSRKDHSGVTGEIDMKHIATLQISNYLGIQESTVKAGKVNLISGGNGTGKSSHLEAIERAITNKGRRTKQVRDEADKSVILLVLDDGTQIKRTITEGSQSVEVKNKDGFTASKPQTYLDSLAGAFAFNPIDFVFQKPEDQKKTLLSILDIKLTPADAERLLGSVPIGINWQLHGLEIQKLLYKVAYDTRTQKNADKKAIENQLKVEAVKLPEGFDPAPYRNISLREKYDELRKAQEHNEEANKLVAAIGNAEHQITIYGSSNDKLQYEINGYIREIDELQRRISEAQAKIDANNQKIATENSEIEALQKQLAEFKPIDTTALESEIESFQEKQGLVVIYDRVQDLTKKVSDAEAVAKDWDLKVETIKALPTELVKSAKLPIDGIGYDGSNFTYKGRPLDNLSDSEKIRFGLDIARSMAKDLKLICVDRFEALGDEAKQEFLKQAETDDFQYFVTERTSGPLQVNTLL